MYICICQGITDKDIKAAVRNGAHSMKALNRQLGVSIQCGKCGKTTKQILRSTLSEQSQNVGVQIWKPGLDSGAAWGTA